MTVNANLPSDWLNERRFIELSDREWRVFTMALMWCNGNGTDGEIASEHYRWIAPDGQAPLAEIDRLMARGVFERTPAGVRFKGLWGREGKITDWGQSWASEVEAYRTKGRARAQKSRDAKKAETEALHAEVKALRSQSDAVAGNALANVRPNVDQDQDQDSDGGQSTQYDRVTSWSTVTIPQSPPVAGPIR